MDNHTKVSDNTLFAIDSMGLELAVKAAYVRGGRVVGIQTEDNRVIESGFAVYTARDFLKLEGVSTVVYEGNIVRLNKFDDSPWRVRKGWYSVNGNPEIWGWYLESIPAGQLRSIQLRDLATIEVIEGEFGSDGLPVVPFNIYVNNEPADRVGNDFFLTMPWFKVSELLLTQEDWEYSVVTGRFIAKENGHYEINEKPVFVGQRILMAGQENNTLPTHLAYNGIWIVTDTGTETSAAVLTRAPDFVISDSIANATVLVLDNIHHANTRWNLTTVAPIVPEETPLVFKSERGNGVVWEYVPDGDNPDPPEEPIPPEPEDPDEPEDPEEDSEDDPEEIEGE
jgi:hypothetical protein